MGQQFGLGSAGVSHVATVIWQFDWGWMVSDGFTSGSGAGCQWVSFSVHLMASHPPEDRTEFLYIMAEVFQEDETRRYKTSWSQNPEVTQCLFWNILSLTQGQHRFSREGDCTKLWILGICEHLCARAHTMSYMDAMQYYLQLSLWMCRFFSMWINMYMTLLFEIIQFTYLFPGLVSLFLFFQNI